MKKQLLLLSVLLTAIPLFGQADLQWLVLKGSGKNGTSGYSNPFGGNTTFILEGITHPDLSNFAYNKNDIFIIYQNGTFYNSRVKNPPPLDHGFFYNSNSSNVTHRFSATQPILYLYLTNIYEKDDPPGGVKAKAGNLAHDDSFNIPTNSASPAAPLSASHDIIRNSDITLILDKAKIFAAADSQNLDVPPSFDFDVYFNTIIPTMPPFNPATNAFFQPYPIFQGNSGVDVAIYPDGFGTYYPSQNKIRISQNCPAFMYVNLRPSSLVTQYYPGLDGNVSNQAKFILTTTGGQEISFLNEDIRSSHDPNFVRIDRICKVSSGEHIVFCHLEFENDSQTAPREIEVSFGLPVQAIKNCFEILEWNLGGQSVYGDFTFNTNSKKVVCTFDLTRPNTPSIQKCDSPLDEPQCSGYINFSYKMDKDYPVWEPETKIFVEKPIVKFDSLDFKVTKFEDLIDVKFTHNTYISSRPISTSHCSTNCNH